MEVGQPFGVLQYGAGRQDWREIHLKLRQVDDRASDIVSVVEIDAVRQRVK
jgi:hypothetical protein